MDKSLCFEQIVLTPEELALLRRLNRSSLWREDCDGKAVDRLRRFDFVEVLPVWRDLPDNERERADAVSIVNRGRDYLIWLDRQEEEARRDSKRDFRREVLLLIIGAALTLLIEHAAELPALLAALLRLAYGLFQRG